MHSQQHVVWQVRVWTGAAGPSDWSDPATFEMGLLGATAWQGRWIENPDYTYFEAAVTNTWFNREVGDAQPGATQIACFQPASRVKVTATTPLLPSGLMGPVRLYQQK